MRLGYNVGMKTHDTIAGSYYGITSPNGCTVTDEYGALNKTIEAGDQLTLQAPGAQLIVDDDEAIVRKSTFNRAALALGLIGGGVKIDVMKYAACTTVEDLLAVNADYKNDLTKDGAWVYELPNMVNFGGALAKSAVRRFEVDLPKATSLQRAFEGSRIEYFKSSASKHGGTTFSIAFKDCLNLEVVDCDMSKANEIFQNFCNCPKLRVVTSSFPKVTTMHQAFNGTQLDKESSVRILTSVPSPYTGSGRFTINIGIHVDHQTEGEVIAAIEAAEAKGWTVAVQWNGTPTASGASTYGLRRRPVYAKLGEPMEDGRPVLDWGHYVTNAEENGYTEFTSLEEAKEHFNITDEA